METTGVPTGKITVHVQLCKAGETHGIQIKERVKAGRTELERSELRDEKGH